MDRNDLLTATRVEFLRAFSAALDELVPHSAQRLFDDADHSASSRDQRRLLDARTELMSHSSLLIQQAAASMEQLLNRGFRTAYSTFRPSFPAGMGNAGLSLVDSSAFEGELRIDLITQRYRNAAEEQLRDLNIRVALLFDQENIQERENPFRPYLFSRSMFSAVEFLGLADELADTLIDRLCDDLVDRVTAIYLRLNDLLADHGIAVQLKPRIHHDAPLGHPHHPPAEAAAETPPTEDEFINSPTAAMSGYGAAHAPHGQQHGMAGRVDQLMHMVRQPMGVGGQHGGGDVTESDEADDGWSVPAEAPEPAKPGLSDIARTGWLAGTEMVGNAMRKFFATGSAPGMPTTPLGGDTQSRRTPLTSSVGGLQRESTPSVGEMWGNDGQIRNLIMEMRPGLNEMAKGVNELMTIDIVAMLFEFILRDDQVPAEVRAQLGRLQFLVLKIALLDPAMFTQKHHPARVLVNRIGSISIGLERAGANTEAMVAEIRQIIERLLADEQESVGLFSRMLDEFDTFIARQLRAADEQVERAVQVLENAENRTLHFARTTATIAEALDGLTLDPFLHDFLINGWAHAIERAARDDIAKAERYRALIPDLIWSIAPKTTKQERDQLLVQIPTMLRTLREGIEMIGWEAAQQQALHGWLIDAHTHALRAGHVTAQVPTMLSMRERFQTLVQPVVDADAPVVKANRGPLNRHVLDEAIKELEVELNLIDRVLDTPDSELAGVNHLDVVGVPSPEAEIAAITEKQAAPEVLERLRSGVAVEINLDGKPSRARLNWISPSESSLVLSIDGDRKPAVVSVRMFLRLLNNGRAKFVEVAPLFERAVQSLLQSADQLDKGTHGALTGMAA